MELNIVSYRWLFRPDGGMRVEWGDDPLNFVEVPLEHCDDGLSIMQIAHDARLTSEACDARQHYVKS